MKNKIIILSALTLIACGKEENALKLPQNLDAPLKAEAAEIYFDGTEDRESDLHLVVEWTFTREDSPSEPTEAELETLNQNVSVTVTPIIPEEVKAIQNDIDASVPANIGSVNGIDFTKGEFPPALLKGTRKEEDGKIRSVFHFMEKDQILRWLDGKYGVALSSKEDSMDLEIAKTTTELTVSAPSSIALRSLNDDETSLKKSYLSNCRTFSLKSDERLPELVRNVTSKIDKQKNHLIVGFEISTKSGYPAVDEITYSSTNHLLDAHENVVELKCEKLTWSGDWRQYECVSAELGKTEFGHSLDIRPSVQALSNVYFLKELAISIDNKPLKLVRESHSDSNCQERENQLKNGLDWPNMNANFISAGVNQTIYKNEIY